MYMLMFVLDDPERLDEVLDAWAQSGVSGITIMESSGFHRRQAHVLGARYIAMLPVLLERIEKGSYTLFSVVKDNSQVEQCIAATERIIGDLGEPNTGVIAAWPVAFAKGLEKRQLTSERDE